MTDHYAREDVLVTTQWVADNLNKTSQIRLVESNEDVLLYSTGHIPNAVHIDWVADLNDSIRRDYLDEQQFAALLSRNGIDNDTTVVFYGDKNNWWATYAFWVFKLFGHEDCRIMNGGRQKWIAEGRELTKEKVSFPATDYQPSARADYKIRAFRDQVLAHVMAGQPLVDVRSPQEFSGELLHMPGSPQEGALRGGHIKGAVSVPWSRAVAEDGTFKSADQLRAIYEAEQGLAPDKNVIAYCRIGERSSHTWFVLTYLLGYPNVRNYDGSWTEWGNLVGVPIENPSKQA
ncbi:MAG: sulfurtransferase [Anaerolineales bacterium]|uniref:sulfurtransferase n=1 Tax=Promineifilum sp. TaxID=2664178 RepID=UPI001D1D9F49|nr:sulfurtransferase [Anaerolineales bacterium]MCB8934877.1 sulfurtransferase [Promineifilum sp.]MCO5178520.1 sulfurtransferase [Promineifilum sp.]